MNYNERILAQVITTKYGRGCLVYIDREKMYNRCFEGISLLIEKTINSYFVIWVYVLDLKMNEIAFQFPLVDEFKKDGLFKPRSILVNNIYTDESPVYCRFRDFFCVELGFISSYRPERDSKVIWGDKINILFDEEIKRVTFSDR